MARKVKRREEISLEIEKVAFGGKGISRIEDYVVFVENTVPGDVVKARVRKARKNYAEAYPIEIIEPSPLRQEAPCSHFGFCGGCRWQNIDYYQQLEFKRSHVQEALSHIGDVNDVLVKEVIPADPIFGYRNKMEFSFSDNRWLTPDELKDPEIKKGFALGFHVPGFYDRIMDIEYCHLQSETLNRILNFTQEYFKDGRLPVYNTHTKVGILRYLVMRESFSDQQIMVNVVTYSPQPQVLKDYATMLQKQIPQVASVVNTVNSTYAQIATGQETLVLTGEPVLFESLENFRFEISPESFFQTNSQQAVKLYQTVRNYLHGGKLKIWDLYCGTGSIGIFVSEKASSVHGFEVVEEAVVNARRNAALNEIDNCTFIAGDLRHQLQKHAGEQPDVIICDPPRAGMHKDVLQCINEVSAEQLIYVSCNPATMARDLSVLKEVYQILEVQPVDMFPHTYHIESVAKLKRK